MSLLTTKFSVIIAAIALSFAFTGCSRPTTQRPIPQLDPNAEMGENAVNIINYLSTNLPGRNVGTAAEAETVVFLTQQLEALNYEVSLQPFTHDWKGKQLISYNVIAERAGSSGKQIIVGAHYDNAPVKMGWIRGKLEGTNDNASGIAIALELAQRLTPDPTHTVKFVFFSAEEVGKFGSEFYADSLSPTEIRNSLVMINLDSLIVGDNIYFNAGRGAVENPDWFHYRDLALEIAQANDIVAKTNPGLNPEYPEGTGCCSDSESFDLIMPVLSAEATNWSLGELDGYTQTSKAQVPNGKTWHDPAIDNLKFTHKVFPGAIDRRTHDFTLILNQLLEQLTVESAS